MAKKLIEAREEHGIKEDDEPRPKEILEFGGFDFAVDLGERFLAAHGQQRMPEGDENAQRADDFREMLRASRWRIPWPYRDCRIGEDRDAAAAA